MARATIQQLRARLTTQQATLAASDAAGVPDEAELQAVLDEGYAMALGALAGREAPAATLQDAELTLACWLLWSRRGFAAGANPWDDAAQNTRARLDAIARGDIGPANHTGDVVDDYLVTQPNRMGSGDRLMV